MKSNIHTYIYYLFKNPYQFLNGLINPTSFPCGNDTDKIIIDPKHSVKKFFKNKTILHKTLQALTILENSPFIPKTINIDTENNMLEQEYCGNILNLKKNLPHNWKQQLSNMQSVFIKKQLLVTDIDLFDLNPYIIYNLCCKENILYIIDLGDWEIAHSEQIRAYFQNLEHKIDYILKCNRLSIVLYVFYILVYKLYNSMVKKLFFVYSLVV